jgi:phosphoribosylaminoimidazolecarboxamide formyltransferase/IMP cyclohydrolase
MPTALFSLTDKSGMDSFARALVQQGWTLLASGGTAAELRKSGLNVSQVADYTGSPEILNGRVKTLHPKIYAGILARTTQEDEIDLETIGALYIDLVVVNLYPFQEIASQPGVELDKVVENIDIGGVGLIRAAAKNFGRVAVVVDPADYGNILAEIELKHVISLETRLKLAQKAFALTSKYDQAIYHYFVGLSEGENQSVIPLNLTLYPIQELRYGENPHQEAMLFGYQAGQGPLGGNLLQGKALSYNNLLDLDAAWRAVVQFEKPTVVIAKHLSPCGIASAKDLNEAYLKAYASDPVSAYGSVIAVNSTLDENTVHSLGELFIECLAAPAFTKAALDLLKARKNLRLLEITDLTSEPQVEYRSVNRGMLRQTIDNGDPTQNNSQIGINWKVVTERQPDEQEWGNLYFAWKACQHVKSNAIVFARDEATVGIGGGQPNRVDCVRIAGQRAGDRTLGAVMASDAFFPFPDSIELAAEMGITAIVQPGGSIRDQESTDMANQHQVAMVFTGYRHFRH